jgi:Ca-activated chloride channel family protein
MIMRRLLAAALVGMLAACSGGPGPSVLAPDAHGPHRPPVVQPPPVHHPPVLPPIAPPPIAPSEPYPGVTFDNGGVNPFVDPHEDAQSTFALDVDTGSYTIARRFLADGNLPDPDSVRVEEYVNAFDGGYEPPAEATFAISADGGPTPFATDGRRLLLRLGISARDLPDVARPDASLTFVIDVSGSMAMETRLELVKRSLDLLVEALRPTDSVAIVVYGSDARIVLPPTPLFERDAVRAAIASLQPEGSTNVAAGMQLGYAVASEAFLEGGINRVIVASDGVANVGVTDAAGILDLARGWAADGIQLVTAGFGMGNYNDTLMEQLADDGDGFYAYVDDVDEARRLFVHDLTGTLTSVALDARAQVDFDSGSVAAYRLVGYENRDVADDRFRDDTVEAGAIGAGHTVTALYELALADPKFFGDIGTVKLRWIDPATKEPAELSRTVTVADLASSFDDCDPHFRLQAAVAAWADLLRGSPWASDLTLASVAQEAGKLAWELRDDPQAVEFAELTQRAAWLAGGW